MYIMFPIGIMYYFGTNLDSRFATPDFWPKAGQTHTIPFEREEIDEELGRLKQRRLAARARRMHLQGTEEHTQGQINSVAPSPLLQTLENTSSNQGADATTRDGGKSGGGGGWSSWFR